VTGLFQAATRAQLRSGALVAARVFFTNWESPLETFGEAFATLRKANVAPHTFLDVMNALFASPVYANYGRLIAEEQFEPAGFALKLGLKDIRLALETAQECASPMPAASLIRDHFLSAIALGQGDLDWSSIARIAARNAGL